NAIVAEIVRRCVAGDDQFPPALHEFIALREDRSLGRRVAEFIDDTAGDGACVRERYHQRVDHLAVEDFDRSAGVIRLPRAILNRDVAALARAERVAARTHVPELEPSARIADRSTRVAGRPEHDERSPEWRP